MNKLQQIVAYLCLHYPHKNELSKARLTKLVYLADWFSALLNGKQLSEIRWFFNHYGPYVDDVISSVNGCPGFKIENSQTIYGSQKNLVVFDGESSDIKLSNEDRLILKSVIAKTEALFFNDFIDYVYSTYPVRSEERYASLDLARLADEYRSQHSNAALAS